MSYFATAYTIHFDDTMAYGSHHFLTGFKFQCAAREDLLYGDLIFDREGVPEALDKIHLFTADAYSRNLRPTFLGDRVAILISIEEWGRVSARFCYRVLNGDGQPICAGFQSMICADAQTGAPVPLPEPLRLAFDAIREIEEPVGDDPFRDRVLKSVEATEGLFTNDIQQTAREYLTDRYPPPRLIGPRHRLEQRQLKTEETNGHATPIKPLLADNDRPEVWVFPGQGAFDARLLCERVSEALQRNSTLNEEFRSCAQWASELVGGDAAALVSGSVDRCLDAVRSTPGLSQIAIHLQSVLGARLRMLRGRAATPGLTQSQPAMLLGHSFGELAALNVAGCYDLPTGVRVVCERVRAVEQHGPMDGGLLAISTNRRIIAEEIAVLGLQDLVIAGRNHEGQTVVSGPRDQLQHLQTQLQAIDISAIEIATPTSFHHPNLRQAARAWLAQLRQLTLSKPGLPVFSPIGRRLITSQADIAAVLSSQFLRPFDLQGAIDDLHTGGFKRFVDCGSTGSLQRLIKAAGPPDIEVTCVAKAQTKSAGESRSAPESTPTVATPAQSNRGLTPASESTHRSREQQRPKVAIIGQGCLLPGRSTSPSELHNALLEGRPGIFDQRDFDPDWERDFFSEKLVPDASTSGLSGLVDDRDIVRPGGVDADLFERFSRTQKLLCVALAQCVDKLKHAKRVLCLLGTTADGFQDQDKFAALRFAGIDASEAAIGNLIGRASVADQDPFTAVQQVLDHTVRPGIELRLIDAACASSLYCVTLGMHALENFEADIVLAGGVYCPGPGTNCLFSQFNGLTATGCRPFDAGADGVVFAEGAALVVLKRLDDAGEAGDQVAAVVRGCGVSSDGRSPSANVPQTAGQLFALQRCYENYAIAPDSVAAVEAHGTSTPVGDATELNTLRTFFATHVATPLPVHSLKGLLGHTGWAAGTASIIAAVESLRTGVFPSQAFHQQPSKALTDASATLRVPTAPEKLPDINKRIAIDGFGFGGSNAHVVVELESESPTTRLANREDRLARPSHESADDELVIVAWHQLKPDNHSNGITRFNRGARPLPDGVMVLPDLADDMDITQSLALSLVDGTISKLSSFDHELRKQTGVVLAVGGKTERAIEATSRILTTRLSRTFAETPEADQLVEASQRARPSGAYTLQCMMPNVAAGRAALVFNLNGPNFVVDAGKRSLEAAFSSASQLLRGGKRNGTQLVIVGAINSNQWPVPGTDPADINEEHAAAFAVTTRAQARRRNLPELCPLESLLSGWDELTTTAAKLAHGIACLTNGDSSSAPATRKNDEFPIHKPVWVESPLKSTAQRINGHNAPRRWLIITKETDIKRLDELLECARTYSRDQLLCIVSAANAALPTNSVTMNPTDDRSLANSIARLVEFAPDAIIAIDTPTTWTFEDAIVDISRNELCETLFLTMQAMSPSIKRCQTEVWGLCPGAWRDDRIHPCTGAISGLLKATKREYPESRLGSVATQERSFSQAFKKLAQEQSAEAIVEQDVVYHGDQRLVRRLRSIDTQQVAADDAEPVVHLDARSVVLATGGARGVTALLMEALLRDYQCTVIALGRSPLEPGPPNLDSPEVERDYYATFLSQHPEASPAEMRSKFDSARARWEAHATVQQLAKAGGHIRYENVDVTDPEAIDQAIAKIVAEFGRIDLVVHGAGIQWSKRLEDRSLDEFRKTFDVKVGGLRRISASCQAHLGKQVPVHVLTSAYSIFGNDGQHDYGAANEAMDRLCQLSGESGAPRWSSIAWSAWNGIGMTRGSEYRTLANKRNLALLDAEAGQRVFRTVMSGRTKSAINVPLSGSERTRYHVRTIPSHNGKPVLQTWERSIALGDLPCLEFHKARGHSTLPGAWIVDYMVEAALRTLEGTVSHFCIRNVRFERFIRLQNHDPHLRVILDRTPHGFVAWMIGNILNPDGIALVTDTVFARAALGEHHMADRSLQLNGELRNGSGTVQTVRDPYCAGAHSVDLSGPFDCLEEIQIGPLGRRARFAPHEALDWGGTIPSMLLDASLRVAGMHCVPDALHVPTKIDRVIVPVGISTDSAVASGWQIRTSAPQLLADEILCDRIEVTNERGDLQLLVEGALVTRLR